MGLTQVLVLQLTVRPEGLESYEVEGIRGRAVIAPNTPGLP